MKTQSQSRWLSSLLLIILAAVNMGAHILGGGLEHTYTDELLAVPMIYFTVRLLYPDGLPFLPELIFAVRAALQGLQYLVERTIRSVDAANFSQVAKEAAPYAKAVLCCFAGMIGLECGRILFRIFRRAYDHRSRQQRRLMTAQLCGILLALAAGMGYLVWEDNAISVSRFTYASYEVSASLHGYKIMQVSDLHNKSFGEHSHFLLKKIREEQPDIILVTGDIVDRTRTDIPVALDFIRQAAEIAPVYYTTGNHEDALSLPRQNELYDGIAEAGGRVMIGQCLTISRSRGVIDTDEDTADAALPDDCFHLIGLENRNLFSGKLHYIMPKTDGLNILMAHQPQAIDLYAQEPVDLVLAGHAHGGQARLPFIGPVYAPGQGFRPTYTEGIYRHGQTSMIVSRGLGNSVFPLRINNRPELVVVELARNP